MFVWQKRPTYTAKNSTSCYSCWLNKKERDGKALVWAGRFWILIGCAILCKSGINCNIKKNSSHGLNIRMCYATHFFVQKTTHLKVCEKTQQKICEKTRFKVCNITHHKVCFWLVQKTTHLKMCFVKRCVI